MFLFQNNDEDSELAELPSSDKNWHAGALRFEPERLLDA